MSSYLKFVNSVSNCKQELFKSCIIANLAFNHVES